MSQTDVTGVAEAVSGITIEGPGTENPVESTWTLETPEGTADITAVVAPGKNVELFDRGAYLDAPMIDGQAADEIVIAFSGSIKFDAADPQGRKLFEDMRLGKSVDLKISGDVSSKQGGWKIKGKEGEEQEVVTGKATVKVTDLFALAPEDL